MNKKAFLTVERKSDPWIEPAERLKSFEEFHKHLDREERLEQASRCMHCGVPFCQSAIELKGMVTGCPLHNLIPEWNEELANENDEYALIRLLKTNPFPEFTSRVCPALCEKACLNGVDSEPTSIHDNEYYIIETGFKNGWVKPKAPINRTGKTVAVIGSGPSGLAAAALLNERGHEVTVFERDELPGGLLQFGIPNMKLDKSVVKRRVDLMKKEGVKFACGVEAGKDISKEDLEKNFDAIVVAAGSRKARGLNVDGMDLAGVHYALDYLGSATRSLGGKKPAINAKNKHVVIVGGGDTGNDCIGTALRQGAKSVVQLEMMKEPPLERTPDNPWPEWPKVKKTDYGQQEAIYLFDKDPRIFTSTVTEIHEKNGKINGVTIASLDDHFKPIPGSEKVLKCDLLLIAAGFVGIEESLKDSLGLPVTNRNVIETNANGYQIGDSKFFACGDCKRGASLVVWAMSQGRGCAQDVDHYLLGYSNIED